MSSLTVSSIARSLGCKPLKMKDAAVTGVSTDTRTLTPGQCFFAIRGENFDGHAFIDQAIEKGASCVVCQELDGEKGNVFVVEDTVKALGRLAGEYRTRLAAKVVAITGSAGKTTTRHILHHCLSGKFRCHQSPKSFNNHIGLPLTLLSTPGDCEILIAEIGANRPGEVESLSKIAMPDLAMVTNVHPCHLEGFATIETIIEEKASIGHGLKPDGLLLANGHFQDLVAACMKSAPRVMTFGQAPYHDIRCEGMESQGPAGRVRIQDTDISVPLPGRANLENVLAAWAVCSQVGLSLDEFAQAMVTLTPADMRLNIENIGTAILINDFYNANLASMANALDLLTQLGERDSTRRRVFVCGEMAELGPHAAGLHTELGTLASHAGVNLLLAVGTYSQSVVQGALKSASQPLEYRIFPDTADLCDKLHDLIRSDDIILVKGSRCMRLESAADIIRTLLGRET